MSFANLNQSLSLIQQASTKGEFRNQSEKTVAFAQLEFLENWKTGFRGSGTAGMSSVQLAAPADFPDLNLILKVQQLRWVSKFLSHAPRSDAFYDVIGELLEQLDSTVDLATDADLIAVGKAFSAHTKLQFQPEDVSINETVEALEDLPSHSTSADLKIITLWLRALDDSQTSEILEQRLEKVSNLARDLGHTFYLLKSLEARLENAPKNIVIQRSLYLESSKLHEQLGSDLDFTSYLRTVSRFERRKKNFREAFEFIKRAKQCSSFEMLPEITKSKIELDYENARRRVNQEDGTVDPPPQPSDLQHEEQLYRLDRNSKVEAVNSFKKQFAKEVEHQNTKADRDKAKSDNEMLLQETSQLSNELTTSQTAQNRYLWISLISLLSLLGAFVVYRFRVSQLALRANFAEQQTSLIIEQNKVLALETKVERLKKSESLGLMAGCVAHDFNNLLQGVSGNLELLKASFVNDGATPTSSSNRDDRVEAIGAATDRARQLAQKMLDYAGKRNAEKTTLDLNDFVAGEIGLVRSTSIAHKFSFQKGNEKLMVKGDKMQLHQVLLNFVTNAVEASETDSAITIRVFKTELEDGQDLSLFGSREMGGNFCVLEVRDEGGGIDQQQIAQVFDPYFSTKNDGGRGLGLAIAYGAAEAHNGWVRCRPNKGPGTTFQLLIPELTASQSTSADADTQTLSPSNESVQNVCDGRKVLIVDDESVVLEACQAMAENLGLQVTAAMSGTEALAILDAQSLDAFDCILMDVVMPEMGAGELLTELETRGIHTPVLIMSGFSFQQLACFRERSMVVGVLPKPFRLKQMKLALVKGLEHRFAQSSSDGKITSLQPHAKPITSDNSARQDKTVRKI